MSNWKRRKVGRSLVTNPASPIGKPIGAKRAKELSLLAALSTKPRRPSPGRPKLKLRCPCGAMGVKRARQRNHKCTKPEVD